jgi:hypothetical protein
MVGKKSTKTNKCDCGSGKASSECCEGGSCGCC